MIFSNPISTLAPSILARLYLEQTPSGGNMPWPSVPWEPKICSCEAQPPVMWVGQKVLIYRASCPFMLSSESSVLSMLFLSLVFFHLRSSQYLLWAKQALCRHRRFIVQVIFQVPVSSKDIWTNHHTEMNVNEYQELPKVFFAKHDSIFNWIEMFVLHFYSLSYFYLKL